MLNGKGSTHVGHREEMGVWTGHRRLRGIPAPSLISNAPPPTLMIMITFDKSSGPIHRPSALWRLVASVSGTTTDVLASAYTL